MIIPPAQLPPDNIDFVGRDQVLAGMDEALKPRGTSATAIQIITVTGMPGAGKTAVAVRAAHRARERFPDGQLFADLSGSTSRPADPADLLRRFLRAVGVPPAQVPPGSDEAATMFRSWTAHRSVLIVLDDAYSAAQIQPLLPGSARCAVIITSRFALPGLAGASVIRLGMLDTAEAVTILAKLAGPEQVAREREAAREVVQLCGRLPLAVCVAGTRLAAIRGWRLSTLATLLRDPRRRLAELRFQGLDVRAGFEFGYGRLNEPEKCAFRLLSLLKEERFTAGRVAGMLGNGMAVAEELLSALVDNHLLQVYPNDHDGPACYGYHELSRAYAWEHMDNFLGDGPSSRGDSPEAAPAAAV